MREMIKLIPWFLLTLLFFGCSDTVDSPENESHPKPLPEFSSASDPKEFFADYWEDLSGERFLPREMQQLFVGRTTPMERILPLMRKHDTVAFIEWYYDEALLEEVREQKTEELQEMEYQLSVMRISREDAAEVLMLEDSAPIQQKTMLLKGEVTREWEKIDEDTWQVTLSRDNRRQKLLVVRKGGSWKLDVP